MDIFSTCTSHSYPVYIAVKNEVECIANANNLKDDKLIIVGC